MKPIGDIRRANLEALLLEFQTLDALAAAAGSTSVYLSQIRNRYKDRKSGKPREMGSQMARRLEAIPGHEKPTGWMDIEHDADQAAAIRLSVAEPAASYVSVLSSQQHDQLMRDLADIPDSLRSKLLDTIHQHAESAREAHEHVERRKRGAPVAAAKHSRRAHRSVRIRIGDGNPEQGVLELTMADDPFSAEPSNRELELYERIARAPKHKSST